MVRDVIHCSRFFQNWHSPELIRHVQNLLQQFSGENIIIGGDFNCPLAKDDKEGGRDPSSKKNVVAEIKLLLSSLDLEDAWRKLHPNDKQFTWRKPDQKIKCRLDYWLVSKHLLRQSPVCNVTFKSLRIVIIL